MNDFQLGVLVFVLGIGVLFLTWFFNQEKKDNRKLDFRGIFRGVVSGVLFIIYSLYLMIKSY